MRQIYAQATQLDVLRDTLGVHVCSGLKHLIQIPPDRRVVPQLATAQDMLMETAIDAGYLHARIEAVHDEWDAWRKEAERLQMESIRSA